LTATDTASPGMTGSAITTVNATDIWIVNGDGSLSELYENGMPQQAGSVFSNGSGMPVSGGAAFDRSGQIWTVNSAANQVTYASASGSNPTVLTGGGVSAHVAIAMDGDGSAWVANSNGSVSEFRNGAAVTPATGYTAGGSMSLPTGISIDLAGNVWVSDRGNNGVTEILGGAAPTLPLAIGTQTNTLGVRP
jgi:hypothetical protein